MQQNRTEGRPVVFLDETWCNFHDGKDKPGLKWTRLAMVELLRDQQGEAILNYTQCALKYYDVHSKPSGKGEHPIVLHAGGKDGWIPGQYNVQ